MANERSADTTAGMLGIELTPDRPVSRLTELGEVAETEGYDAIFVSHHYNNRDAFAALSRLAARTEESTLGPGVINPLEVHPVTLASKIATLDEVSDGRAAFGIGPGDPSTLRNLGLADDRSLRPVLEAFEGARELWAGERITRDGSFRADDAGLNYAPPQGRRIPVYVGGEGPHMCRMAGKRADGLLFNGSHPEDLKWARDRVREGRARRSSDAKPTSISGTGFDLAAYAAVSVAEHSGTARTAAREPTAFITAGAAPPVLDRHGIDAERAADIGDLISAGEFSEAFDQVTPSMIDAFAVAGTVEEVADRVAALLDYADSLVVGTPLGPDPEAAIRLAAEAYDRALEG